MYPASGDIVPFGGCEALEAAGAAAPAVAILPVPYDATTCYRPGTRMAPAAICEASTQMELFDEELQDTPLRAGVLTLPPLPVDARGPEHMVAAVQQAVREQLRQGRLVITLGGEHSLTLGCVAALAEAGLFFDVVQLDAHADLRDSYQNSRYSHACVMRRVAETCRVFNVGLRSLCEEEHRFLRQSSGQAFSMNRIRRQADWIEQLLGQLSEQVYLTVDCDVFDPAVCPGVGTPEPGGLDWFQVTGLLRRLLASKRLVGADVVECIPGFQPPVSEFLAARLVYKIIGYWQNSSTRR